MFTLKHIRPNGEEFAMECASYAIDPLEPLRSSNEKRFRLLTFDTPHRQDDYSGLWVGRRCNRWPGAEEIHIMNRFGATVASHYFESDDAPLFGGDGVPVDGLMQADMAAQAQAA